MSERDGTSLGDLFNQRRAAKKQQKTAMQQQTQTQPPSSSSPKTASRRPPSLLDIQAEQSRSSQQQSRSPTRFDRGSSRGSSGRRKNDRSDLPLEQGAVCSLKDSFGFVHCADRDDDIFFHYSEVNGCHPADLHLDDEVEFRVGPARNDEEKLSAYTVRRLEPGTIQWEMEDEPGVRFQGLVERPARSDSRGGGSTEGTIRLLLAPTETSAGDDKEEKDDTQEPQVDVAADEAGPLIQFFQSDVTHPDLMDASDSKANTGDFRRLDSTNSASSRGGTRLGRNDLVAFNLVTERRTGNKYARSISLIQSERERQREAKEKELLANATLERGIVTRLKNDYGFLRSNRRREEIYFHYSNVVLPDDGNYDDDDGSEHVLKEGQEMEFLVVTEPGSGGRNEKMSAREVRFLPAGSVVFHTVLAQGVTGVITRCPHPTDSGYATEMVGSVRLSRAIKDQDEGSETSQMVSDALLYAADSPGGSFSANRDGSSVGMWANEGDTLLFDLVKETVDGSYRVAPTAYKLPPPSGSASDETARSDEPDSDVGKDSKAVRLISTSFAGRAEGVVHAIKDNYGFIHCAERPVDAYFRLYELLPDEIQEDLRRNMGLENAGASKLELKIGAEVQFDLSLQGTIALGNARSKGRNGGTTERENLKAQRLLLLPPSTIVETKVIAEKAKGVVTKEDPKQTYAGLIELEETLKPMSLAERHPLVAQLAQSILDWKNATDHPLPPIVFHDLQSVKEDEVVTTVIDALGKGQLTCTHVPVASDSGHPGRLCISFLEQEGTEDKNDEGSNDALETAVAPEPQKKGQRKKKQNKEKPVKVVRYDKHCLVADLQKDMPPGKGDIVECTVVQSRRTGMVGLTNVRMLERVRREDDEKEAHSGVGVVMEVVTARKFGFISLLDENASKREMLFFHLSSVDKDSERSAGLGSSNHHQTIRKGDEVKFDITIGKNGKRTAFNIVVLPKGSLNISTAADKNACRGFILMEPSHSSLSNTPTRQAAPATKQADVPIAGRWHNVDADELSKSRSGSKVKEGGIILLVDDPTNMFAPKKQTESTDGSAAHTSFGDAPGEQEIPTNGERPEEPKRESSSPTGVSAIGTHLTYNAGACAVFGTGASSMVDNSSAPRRGDLVSFVKAKNGNGVRDIRVITRDAATRLRGRLGDIASQAPDDSSKVNGRAKFYAATDKEEVYDIDLSEFVSCDPSLLKDKESVEGILHQDKIFGVCRTCDLYLQTKRVASHKERPRLNLTVRKELKNLGGKIMAQSMMAKGPDGTNGFGVGWTRRVSQYASLEDSVPQQDAAGASSQEPTMGKGEIE